MVHCGVLYFFADEVRRGDSPRMARIDMDGSGLVIGEERELADQGEEHGLVITLWGGGRDSMRCWLGVGRDASLPPGKLHAQTRATPIFLKSSMELPQHSDQPKPCYSNHSCRQNISDVRSHTEDYHLPESADSVNRHSSTIL
jgi:hypothetical protein